MSNDTNDPTSCRIDIFKPSGKWYDTEFITMSKDEWDSKDLHTNFKRAVNTALKDRFNEDGWIIVCLEPYSKFEHPLMLIRGSRYDKS